MTTHSPRFAPAFKLALGAVALLTVAAVAPKASFAATSHDGAAAQVAEGENYEVRTEVVGECKVGMECVARIIVNSKGEFHVNDTYPFKFTAAAPNAEFHGSGGNVYAAGDFVREKTRGTMTIKFKPAAKGPMSITGKYKICICSDKICSPQVIDVSIPVFVK